MSNFASEDSNKKTPKNNGTSARDPKRVALIIDTSHVSGRDELEGIGRFNREEKIGWIFHHRLRGIHEPPDFLKSLDCDGIICRIQSAEWIDVIKAKKLPTIDMLAVHRGHKTPWPKVTPDQQAIAIIGFEHLNLRGYKSFAFFGLEDEWWSMDRFAAFKRAVEKAQKGQKCAEYLVSRPTKDTLWKERIRKMADWLRTLTPPVGIFICSDEFGPEAMEACQEANLLIPTDVGLLSVDNDQTLCLYNQFELSSIDGNHEVVGYVAAEHLNALFKGEYVEPYKTVPPKDVVPRKTTATHVETDPHLVAALNYIRSEVKKYGGNPTVPDIASKAGTTLSKLNRIFKRVFGTSVIKVVEKERLSKAKNLLVLGDLAINKIAIECGYGTPSHFSKEFGKSEGCVPKTYRKMHKH